MTTIAIERELLVRIEKELFLARNYGGTLRDEPLLKKVSTVLALAELERLKSEFDSIIEAIGDDPAPSTAPDELERLKTESEERLQNCAALVAEVERLRAAPATAPERKPMTPEQIETMWPSPEGTNSIHALVREVEAFHGIKETP